jgi:hypothetical protein
MSRRPCDGCGLVPKELSTIAQQIALARDREQPNLLEEPIERLRLLIRRTSGNAAGPPPTGKGTT